MLILVIVGRLNIVNQFSPKIIHTSIVITLQISASFFFYKLILNFIWKMSKKNEENSEREEKPSAWDVKMH